MPPGTYREREGTALELSRIPPMSFSLLHINGRHCHRDSLPSFVGRRKENLENGGGRHTTAT